MNLTHKYFLNSQYISTNLKGQKLNINCTMDDERAAFRAAIRQIKIYKGVPLRAGKHCKLYILILFSHWYAKL